MMKYPTAFGHALGAADMSINGAIELALLGDLQEEDFKSLAAVAAEKYVPSLVLAAVTPGARTEIALLHERPLKNRKATAYVCKGYVCDAPTVDPTELGAQLDKAPRPATG